MSNLYSTARLDLILRQNAAMAAAVGRYQVSMDPAVLERWPNWRYIAGPNHRATHGALDGMIRPKDDPIWHRVYPPWDFNCNCDVEDSDGDVTDPPAFRIEPPESGFAFDPAQAFRFGVDHIDDDETRAIVEEQIKLRFPEKSSGWKKSGTPTPGGVEPGGTLADAVIPQTAKARKEHAAAMEALGNVHDLAPIADTPLEFMTAIHDKDNKDFFGETNVDGAGRVTGVKVFYDGPRPALTLVHEVGHVIDFRIMRNRSPAITQAKAHLLDVLKASDEYKALQEKLAELETVGKLGRREQQRLQRLRYLMSDDELIARSYAQFIAQRQKSGLVLEEFKNDVILNNNNYFQSCSGAVAGCFDGILNLLR